MILTRYRWIEKKKKGTSYFEQFLFATHEEVVEVVIQKQGNVVIALFPNQTRLILNISYPSPHKDEKGRMCGYGYLDCGMTVKKELVAPKENWIWME